MRGRSGSMLFLVAAVALAGCLDRPLAPTGLDPSAEPFTFEWSPPAGTKEVLTYAVADVAPGVTCLRPSSETGEFGHHSWLAAYEHWWTDTHSVTGVVSYETAAAHHGSGHTVPVWNEAFFPPNSAWFSEGTTVLNGTAYHEVRASLDRTDSAEPWFSLDCDGADVTLRFYVAHRIVPIHSATADGGTGVYASLLHAAAGHNAGDFYELTAEGDLVVLDLLDSFGRLPVAFVEASIDVSSPSDRTTYEYELEGESWNHHETWTERGRYEVRIDRTEVNRGSFKGVLGDTVLVADLCGTCPG